MSSSPYVAAEIKDYMRKFTIEQTINTSINELLRNRPEDPYSFLIGLFQKKCTPDIQVLDISMTETISGEGFAVISLRVKINYLNQPLQFTLEQPYGISSDENNLFDQQGKGMKTGISFYNQKIQPIIRGKKFKCSEQQLVDSELIKAYVSNGKKGLYQVNSISFSLQSIKSRIFCQPLYEIYADLVGRQIKNQQSPKFFVNCLHGGKVIGSKCKVFKYYLISSAKEGLSFISTVISNIKKTITSGKGGEAALKYSFDGTFICPLDTIMDNLKIVEDAINNTPGAKDHLKIGLSWQADTLFSQDTKKYELQNPKTPFDNDQMIEYLVKLLTDKPIINYIEDPLASTELASWVKLKKRVKQTEAIKNVRIGARSGNLLNTLSENFKERLNQISVPMTGDSHPDVPAEQRDVKNSLKFTLDHFQIRLSELQTVSNLLKIHQLLQKTQTQLILQDNCYETYNTELVDVCFGLDSVCNIGSTVKFDRLSKVYRAIQIVKERENPL